MKLKTWITAFVVQICFAVSVQAQTVHLSVAASMTNAFNDIVAGFTAAHSNASGLKEIIMEKACVTLPDSCLMIEIEPDTYSGYRKATSDLQPIGFRNELINKTTCRIRAGAQSGESNFSR